MKPIEIVVCRYREDTPWIDAWSRVFPVLVYDKFEAVNGLPANLTHGPEVVHLKNVGRETQAWFHHFLSDRWRGARHTVFLQADPTPHIGASMEELAAGLINYLRDDPPYVPLSNMQIICDHDGAPHHAGLPMRQYWTAMWPGRPLPDRYEGWAGGQFIVRQDLIARYPRAFWRKGYDLTSGDPKGAYVFERLWDQIWKDGSHTAP